jgi:hypothetical protein
MPEKRKVYSDLVGSTRDGFAEDQGEARSIGGVFLEARENLAAREGHSSIGVGALFKIDFGRALCTLPEQGPVEFEMVLLRPSPDECEVFFCDGSRLHEQVEISSCSVVFRHERESAGFPV